MLARCDNLYSTLLDCKLPFYYLKPFAFVLYKSLCICVCHSKLGQCIVFFFIKWFGMCTERSVEKNCFRVIRLIRTTPGYNNIESFSSSGIKIELMVIFYYILYHRWIISCKRSGTRQQSTRIKNGAFYLLYILKKLYTDFQSAISPFFTTVSPLSNTLLEYNIFVFTYQARHHIHIHILNLPAN